MTGYVTRNRIAIVAALAAAVLLPFRAKPGSKPSLQARLVAVTLADQAGRALGVQAGAGR
ncbi:MAG: hypothetical protein WAL72_05070 [Streptosporangiaceae bacterium]